MWNVRFNARYVYGSRSMVEGQPTLGYVLDVGSRRMLSISKSSDIFKNSIVAGNVFSHPWLGISGRNGQA